MQTKNIKYFVELIKDHNMAQLADEYIELVLEGKRNQAFELIMDKVNSGVSIKDLYLQVFQPVQYEIGLLWEKNKISVATEHFSTAVTQLIMSQLFPYILSNRKNGYSMVACCVGSELHELGMRMVADFFEMDGWDTYFVGANTPLETIVQLLQDRHTDLLALSVTMEKNVPLATDLIKQIKDEPDVQNIKILVGGLPFRYNENLWQSIGAHAFAEDAQKGIEKAKELVVSRSE
jgi:methanogenic corrinoid protein MtbC1